VGFFSKIKKKLKKVRKKVSGGLKKVVRSPIVSGLVGGIPIVGGMASGILGGIFGGPEEGVARRSKSSPVAGVPKGNVSEQARAFGLPAKTLGWVAVLAMVSLGAYLVLRR